MGGLETTSLACGSEGLIFAERPACWITFSGVLCLSCGVLLTCISALGTGLLCCTTSRTWEADARAEKGREALTGQVGLSAVRLESID